MKSKPIATFLLCGLSLLGCSQNSFAPTQAKTDSTLKPSLPAQGMTTADAATPISLSNLIQEDRTLADPLDKGDMINVTGDVQFVVHKDPILIKDQVQVQISFNGQAMSSVIDGPTGWPIKGETVRTVVLGEKGARFDDAYIIEGCFEPLSLNISYLVTNTQLYVDKMWLATTNAGGVATK